MRHNKKLLLIGAILCISLTGCQTPKTKAQEAGKQQETTLVPTKGSSKAEDVTFLPDNTAFRLVDRDTQELGLIVNQPQEEDLKKIEILETSEQDQTQEQTLIIPKYKETTVEVFALDYKNDALTINEKVYSKAKTPEGFGLLLKAVHPEGIPRLMVKLSYEGQSASYIVAYNMKDGNEKIEYLRAETQKDKDWNTILPLQDKNYVEGLNLINSSKYDMDQDGIEEELQLYSESTLDKRGEYQLDDGQLWALIIKKDDKIYPIYERDFLQLGTLKYTTYVDYTTDNFHILIDCTQGAGIKLYDCYYDVAADSFKRSIVYETQGNISVQQEWKK